MNNQIIQNASTKAPEASSRQSVASVMESVLDGNKMRKRFEELLGKRTPQFISSIVTMVNASPELQKAMFQSPITVVQAGLKAATYDLPIDSSLGYAYIVPIANSKKDEQGNWNSKMEAVFIPGYKGILQLALRTGFYKTINVLDVRVGELKSFNRLTEDIEIEFIDDDDEREKAEIVGYVGYYKLVNGTTKTIYRTVKQLNAHEEKFRKGKYMGKGWRDDPEAMRKKTVLRELIGKWGIMSIDYRTATPEALAAVEAIAKGDDLPDETNPDTVIPYEAEVLPDAN